MNRIALAVAISLLAGMAVGGLITGARTSGEPPVVATAGDTAGPGTFDERVERLEQIVAEERNARFALEDTLAMLFDELERLEGSGSAAVQRSEQAAVASETRPARGRPARNESDWMRDYQERRVGRLVDGGFSEDEARRVLQQESEAAFKAMQLEWEALRSGEAVDPFSRANNPQSILRESLGDDAYARYLEAQGQSTAINVTQVLSGSPGSDAGLQPGDQVVSYSGERVFNVTELRNLSMQGDPGEDVVIEVDRDGVRMQLTVPRGPIGITGSGARIRGMRGWGG